MKRRILFYSDAREFGGHEYMTASAAGFMAEQPDLEVGFAYYERNSRLEKHLSSLSRLALYPLPVKSEGLPGIKTLTWMSRLPFLRELMERLAPDAVVLSQGDIRVSSIGLLAAKRAKRRTVSYIPLARKRASRFWFTSLFHDATDHFLYRLPDEFITISEGVKEELRQRGVVAPISVVHNGIELGESEVGGRLQKRKKYGFSEDEYIVALVGRIAFRQKAQDLLVEAVAGYREQLKGTRFCVMGDGPDEQKLRRMIRERGLTQCISFLPWSWDVASLYSAADMLLIPSRFEGVPLVMLEAMWRQLVIVASNVDGMAELLPGEWLFRCGDAKSMVDVISRVRQADNTELLVANKKRILEEFSMPQFQKRFCAAITHNESYPFSPGGVNKDLISSR